MFELTVKDADVGWSIVASGKCKKRTNRALASSLRLPHPLPLTEPTHGRETKVVGRPNRSKGKKGGTPLLLPEDSTSAAQQEVKVKEDRMLTRRGAQLPLAFTTDGNKLKELERERR